MCENQVNDKIEASLVAEDDRLSFLPKHLGEKLMMQFESAVYLWMRSLAPDYSGGHWNFHELSNGGFYMAPSKSRNFQMRSPNYAQYEVSMDAAGIIATMFALNEIINRIAFDEEQDPPEHLVEGYYFLRDFIVDHPEAAAIFALID